MAACEARREAKIDTKLASIVALLENRLHGTEQSEGGTSLGKRPRDGRRPTSRQDDAFRQLTKKVDKRKHEKKGREALREAQALDRGNIGNDESDNESSDQFDDKSDAVTELDEAGSSSRNPSLADTDEDISPISKLPKIAGRGGRGGRGVRGSRSGAIQRGAQATSIKMNVNTMMRRKGALY
ncbi:hypothetical protein K3495_g14298 [Podosphaera aphanis]|nr:hypothetical protein K3495_g14298 [Podosphaera aphanis]